MIGDRDWLLREPKARSVTPFPSLPRGLSVVSGSKPLLNNCYDSREQRLLADYAEAHKQSRRFIVVKGGFRRDFKYWEGRRPSLSLRKGFAREALMAVERGIGYCASQRLAS